jgi:hypothetical protein
LNEEPNHEQQACPPVFLPAGRQRPGRLQPGRGGHRTGGATGTAVGAADTVHCYEVNSCKGMSDCKTTEHACKGQNSCKGHGFKAMDAKSCLMKGGVISDL